MQILIGLRWSALRTEVDPLSGASAVLPVRFGIDPASAAALSWAFRLAAPTTASVTAVTQGPASAEDALREALSLGAQHAIRIDGPAGCSPSDVAAALAPLAAEADLIILGAYSIDGGSGAVAPSLAAILERPQACGLLSVAWEAGSLAAERRLPGGRRERLRLPLPAVISMEAGTSPLSRASLPGWLEALAAEVRVVVPERTLKPRPVGTVVPYRPRPRTVPAPPQGDTARERIAALTGALDGGSHAQQVQLPPDGAAVEIIAALRRWGYLAI